VRRADELFKKVFANRSGENILFAKVGIFDSMFQLKLANFLNSQVYYKSIAFSIPF